MKEKPIQSLAHLPLLNLLLGVMPNEERLRELMRFRSISGNLECAMWLTAQSWPKVMNGLRAWGFQMWVEHGEKPLGVMVPVGLLQRSYEMKMNGLKKNVCLMVLLVLFVLMGCDKPQAEENTASDQAAVAKPEEKKSDANPYELVSVEWVKSQASNSASQQTAYWNEEQPEGGLMLVMKLKGNEAVEYYSSDFSLGYIDDAGIPRSACMGISMGVMQTDQIKQSSWMLAGSMSRSWASQEKPYFGLLFSVPLTIKQVTLYLAQPAMKDIELTPAPANK